MQATKKYKDFLRSLRRLVTANVVRGSSILVTLMMQALSSSEMSVLTRATRRNNPEDAILPCILLVGSHSSERKYQLQLEEKEARDKNRKKLVQKLEK
jgi:hypothetical protein